MRTTLTLLAALAISTTAQTLEIGETASDVAFKDIRYLSRTLADFGEKDAYVLTFVTVDCPVAQRYLPVLEQFHQEFSPRVQFIAVNVGPEDTIQDAAYLAITHNVSFPIVKDFAGDLSRSLGVDRTAMTVVLDTNRTLRYRGRVNDQYRLSGVRPEASREDLRLAIQSVLAGEAVETSTTQVDGCAITFPEPIAADDSLTWAEHVAPVLYQNCVECHRDNGGAPFTLVEYENANRFANMIAEVVAEERMPPWYALDEYGTWHNERRLTSEQKETLIAWARSARNRGNLAKAPAAPEFPESIWNIGEPDLIIQASEPEELPASGYIPYRYVTLPYEFPADTYVDGIQIQPANKDVVHHANLIYMVKGKPGFTFLSGKVPGSSDALLPQGEAMMIPKGAVLTFQIHYVTTGKPETDQIAVGFTYADGPVKRLVHNQFLEQKALKIPAGHGAAEFSAAWTLPDDVTGRALFSHMHLRGKDMVFDARYPDGTEERMLVVPNYSFDWQLAYEFEPGVRKFPKGTEFQITAHYDNSEFNPFNPDPTIDATYGPQTINEMCIGVFYYTKDNENLDLIVDGENGQLISGQLTGAD